MCACDGVEPEEALVRSRGGYRRQVNALKEKRQAMNERKKKEAPGPPKVQPPRKKRKTTQRFKRVGKLRDNNIVTRTKKKKVVEESEDNSSSSDDDDDDKDSDYLCDNDIRTCYEESIAKEAKKKPITRRKKKIEQNNDSTTQMDLDLGFQLEIETEQCSMLDDSDIATTIAQKVMRSRRETEGRQERRFVMTNMKCVNEDVDDFNDGTIPGNLSTTIDSNMQQNISKSRTKGLEDFLEKLNLQKHWLRVIPSFCIRETAKNIQSSSSKASFGRLASLGIRMIDSALKLLCPGPGCFVFKSHVISKMDEKIKKTEMKRNDPNFHKNPYVRTLPEILDTVYTSLCLFSKKSKKRSIERRVVRAIIHDSFLSHEVKALKKKYGLKLGNDANAQARADALEMRQGRKLIIKTITRQNKDDRTVQKCVDFILSDNNVSSVAWGTKRVLLQSIGELTLPKLTRKTTISSMYEMYNNITSDDNDRLMATSFFSICNVLTNNDEAMLKSIDYVSGLLCNETCETLQEIIDRIVPMEHRVECTNLVSIAKNFMKNQFKDYFVSEDDCCFHGINYALSRDKALRENTNDNGCKFPFYVCHYLTSLIDGNPMESDMELRTDAVNVIGDIREKFELFLAHQARCKCQSMAIDQAEKDIKTLCVNTKGKVIKALIIIDFKMKYEMKSTRETTIEHFGKRGIGWHGFAIIFYLLDDKGQPYKNIVYLDQILSETNMQNAMTVVALLETAIATIISELPFLKEAIITSDNATCYQNHFVTFMMAIFNKKFHGQFFIESFLHTETQDGKSLLDAHFATSNRHLLTFVKTWRTNRVTRINTARGLAYALSFKFGLKNSMVQLVEFDFAMLNQLKTIFDKLIVKCGMYYNRTNQIIFQKLDHDGWGYNTTQDYLEQIQKTKFTFKVNAYSNVNPTVEFCVDVQEGKITVDEQTENLISSIFEKNAPTQVATNSNVLQASVTNIDRTMDPTPIKQQQSDFSAFRRTKKAFIDKLEAVGALNLLSIDSASSNNMNKKVHSNDSDSDSDYNDDSSENTSDGNSTDDDLDDYFLNDDTLVYGKPPDSVFSVDTMITSTKLIRFLPLGSLRKKKATKTKRSRISKKKMIKGVTDTAVRYAQNHIKENNLFNSRHKLDPIVERAADFCMHPFENGWARRRGHGKSYGVSYIESYEEDLKEMFGAGAANSSNKMSAGKMREVLIEKYPCRFSLPGETEIKQFIGKLSQQDKKSKLTKDKPNSNRGRKSGKNEVSWYGVLKEIIELNPTEKPEVIYKNLIETFNDNLPNDFPMVNDEPDKDKVKSTISRFKTKIRNDAKRSILI